MRFTSDAQGAGTKASFTSAPSQRGARRGRPRRPDQALRAPSRPYRCSRSSVLYLLVHLFQTEVSTCLKGISASRRHCLCRSRIPPELPTRTLIAQKQNRAVSPAKRVGARGQPRGLRWRFHDPEPARTWKLEDLGRSTVTPYAAHHRLPCMSASFETSTGEPVNFRHQEGTTSARGDPVGPLSDAARRATLTSPKRDKDAVVVQEDDRRWGTQYRVLILGANLGHWIRTRSDS